MISLQIFIIKTIFDIYKEYKKVWQKSKCTNKWFLSFWSKYLRDLVFLQTSPDKFFLNESIIFYDIKITSGWFYYTDMFIRCIISPKKIGRSLTEVNCVKIRSFRENFNHDRTTFLLAQSLFLTISTSLKWNGGPGWITNIFNVHWGILGAIVSIRIIQR